MAIMGKGLCNKVVLIMPLSYSLLLHCYWERVVGWRGPDAGHEGQHVQAASHHQGGGEEKKDREDEPHSGHPVHGLLAAIPCLLHSGILSTRYARYVMKHFWTGEACSTNTVVCVSVCLCVYEV